MRYLGTDSLRSFPWFGFALRPLLMLLVLSLMSACSRREPVPDDAFVVLLEARPRALDPRFALSDYDVKVSRLIFSGLVTMDTMDGRPAPNLAASVDLLDPLHVRVRLREGLRFHDGTPLTSADVAYSYGELGSERVCSPFAGAFRDVRIETPDARTIDFHLPEPNASFVTELDRGVVPRHLLHDAGRFAEGQLVGSGPFRYVTQHRDGTVVLAAWEDYHGGSPQLSHLVFRAVEDDTSRLLALLSGSAHLVLNATSPLMLPVVDRYQELVVEKSPSFKYTYLAFNLEHPHLSRPLVREAIALALDREAIIEAKFNGAATLSTGMLPPDHWAYHGDVRRWDHDLDAARDRLREAGFSPDAEGCYLRLSFKTSANRFRRALVEVMAAQLREAGICVRTQAYEWGTFFEDVRTGNFELATLQWPSVLDPSILDWVFHSRHIPDAQGGGGGNRGRYRNAEVDALLDAARVEPTLERRLARYARVQEILAQELPYVSLWHEDNVTIRYAWVTGFQATPNARFRYLDRTRLQARGATSPGASSTLRGDPLRASCDLIRACGAPEVRGDPPFAVHDEVHGHMLQRPCSHDTIVGQARSERDLIVLQP